MLWWVRDWWELGDCDRTSLFSLTVYCLQPISSCQRIRSFPFETALHEGAAWQGGIKSLYNVHPNLYRVQLLLPVQLLSFNCFPKVFHFVKGTLSPYLYSCKLKDLLLKVPLFSDSQIFFALACIATLLCSKFFFTIMEKMQVVGRRGSWTSSKSSPFLLLKWKTPYVGIIPSLGRGRR